MFLHKWHDWLTQRMMEGSEKKPDYSLDRFVSMTQDLGKDVNTVVDKAKEEEDKVDKEKEKKAKEKPADEKKPVDIKKPEPPKPEVPEKEKEDEELKSKWDELKKLHKERLSQFDKKQKNKPKTK